MRLLVVQCDDESPIGALEVPLHAAGLHAELWRPHAGEATPSLDAVDAVLALGGRVDPNDDIDWLHATRDLIGEAARTRPYLGLCLGAELLAQAAGGAAPPSGTTEIGWQALRATEHAGDDPLTGTLLDGHRAFEWHTSAIEAPAGSTVLARSDEAVQAFRVGTRAWGLQFHAEIEMSTAGVWLVKGADEAVEHGVDPDAVRRQSLELMPQSLAFAQVLAARFAAVARGDVRGVARGSARQVASSPS